MRERTPFPAGLVERLPNLRLLLSTGARNLGLDLDAFKARGIAVTGSPNHGGPAQGPDSTTQHFVALLLGIARNIAADDLSVKTGGWQAGIPPAVGLSGKVYGTVGLGRLGVSTAKLLHLAFNMKVIAWSPNLTQAKADAAAEKAGLPVGTFVAVSREALFSTADVVAVHIMLSEWSRGLVTGTDLARLKPDAIFINTSRGPIVVEADLLAALRTGTVKRVALDVFDTEPLPANSPWRTTTWGRDGGSQVLLSPHMGYGEGETMDRWYRMQLEDLQRWAVGEELAMRLA